jgi:hypothetical protein
VSPSNYKTLLIFAGVPLDGPSASSPLHAVRKNSIDRSETHFVKFALKSHISHTECVVFACFCAFDTEVEPRFIMAYGRIR